MTKPSRNTARYTQAILWAVALIAVALLLDKGEQQQQLLLLLTTLSITSLLTSTPASTPAAKRNTCRSGRLFRR